MLKHWNMLLGKAIPITMTVHLPKVAFLLKSLVLVVKSKPKVSDFFRELRNKCEDLLFFTAGGICVTDSIICWKVA